MANRALTADGACPGRAAARERERLQTESTIRSADAPAQPSQTAAARANWSFVIGGRAPAPWQPPWLGRPPLPVAPLFALRWNCVFSLGRQGAGAWIVVNSRCMRTAKKISKSKTKTKARATSKAAKMKPKASAKVAKAKAAAKPTKAALKSKAKTSRKAKARPQVKASPKTKSRTATRARKQPPRRDGSGRLDPKYARDLRALSRENNGDDNDRAFFKAPRTGDDLAEELGEEAVGTMTSGEAQGDRLSNEEVEEERGGPFVKTGGEEFAGGTDRSNPRDATREPFPRT